LPSARLDQSQRVLVVLHEDWKAFAFLNVAKGLPGFIEVDRLIARDAPKVFIGVLHGACDTQKCQTPNEFRLNDEFEIGLLFRHNSQILPAATEEFAHLGLAHITNGPSKCTNTTSEPRDTARARELSIRMR
jgi:hypothetical protein